MAKKKVKLTEIEFKNGILALRDGTKFHVTHAESLRKAAHAHMERDNAVRIRVFDRRHKPAKSLLLSERDSIAFYKKWSPGESEKIDLLAELCQMIRKTHRLQKEYKRLRSQY